MGGTSLPPSGLSRREFLRRAGMAAVATAAAGGVFGATAQTGLARGRSKIPVLDVSADVTGIARLGDHLVAVGGHYTEEAARPAAWTCRLSDASWVQSASADAFPSGTVLAAVSAIGQRFIAVGHTREVTRVQTIVDEHTGQPIHLPIVAVIPAIFSSTDGRSWRQVLRGVPGSPLGAFGAVTTTPGAAQALAVGSESMEAGVCGGYGVIAMTSIDGLKWENTDLLGVAPPRHGSVTLLARVRNSTLLGTRGIHDIGLYVTSGDAWRRIAAPAQHVGYVAAGATAETFILAGVDDLAQPRYWKRIGEVWHELRSVPGIPRAARLADFEDIDGSLVATGTHSDRGFVRAIGG
jgi:hypothetical protein